MAKKFGEALQKAGVKTSKSENYRTKKAENKKEKHQQVRIYCEVCETTQQDVERYKHRNALVDAEWICSNCADKNSILDECRQTQQSHASKSGMFRRYYGPMKDFTKENKLNGKDSRGRRQGKPKYDGRKRFDKQRNDKPKKKNYIIDENGEKNFNC